MAPLSHTMSFPHLIYGREATENKQKILLNANIIILEDKYEKAKTLLRVQSFKRNRDQKLVTKLRSAYLAFMLMSPI